jgi:hypothetical protein
VREVKKFLRSYPGWTIVDDDNRRHLYVTNQSVKIWIAKTPSTGEMTVIKNLRQQIDTYLNGGTSRSMKQNAHEI